MLVEPALGADNQQLFDILSRLCSRGFHRFTSVDPALLEALGVPEGLSPAQSFLEARARLLTHAERLTVSQRIVFIEAGGFRQSAPTLAARRFQEAGLRVGRSERTARRILKDALTQLATELAWASVEVAGPGRDYVFTRVHQRIDLRRDEPIVVTERTMSAHVEGITHLDERLYFPRLASSAPNVLALEGCRVESQTELSPGLWAVRLSLRHPLALGERHTFSVSTRVPNHAALTETGFMPHTESLDVTIDFHFGRKLPLVIERFIAPPPLFTHGVEGAETEHLIPTGRSLSVRFPHLRLGMAHGVRWRWDATEI